MAVNIEYLRMNWELAISKAGLGCFDIPSQHLRSEAFLGNASYQATDRVVEEGPVHDLSQADSEGDYPRGCPRLE